MTPGDHVRVRVFNGRYMDATLVSLRGDTARVQFLTENRSRIVALRNVSKAENDNAVPDTCLESAPVTESPGLVAQPKQKTWRSEKYKAFVREFACAHCNKPPPSEASHHGPHGMSLKSSDASCIPLCGGDGCHHHWHQKGRLPGLDRTQTEAAILLYQNRTLTAYVEGL